MKVSSSSIEFQKTTNQIQILLSSYETSKIDIARFIARQIQIQIPLAIRFNTLNIKNIKKQIFVVTNIEYFR